MSSASHPAHLPGPLKSSAALLTAAALIASSGLPGCARGPGSPTGAGSTQSADRARTPDVRAMNAPPPPGLDPALAAPLDAADPKAVLPLQAAVQELSAAAEPESPAAPEPPPAREPTVAARSEALRLYTQGRIQRLQGQASDAVKSLQSAARLDPGAWEIWRELGEANLAIGNRAFASAAFSRALKLNPADARVLEQTSRIALERREYQRAGHLTAKMLALPLAQTDPALPYIVWSQLARSLGELGYTGAAAEASMKAADLPTVFPGPTSRIAELNALYRQRGDTLRDAGDAMLRLARYDQAAEAYAKAAAMPTLTPSTLVPRRVFASMKQGDPRAAAELLVAQIQRGRGRGEDQLLALIAHVSVHSASGSSGSGGGGGAAVRRGLDTLESELSERDRTLASGYITRARAAASDNAAATALLRKRLAAAPSDEDALRELFARVRTDGPAKLITQTIQLVRAAPMQERRYGTALGRELAAFRITARPDAGANTDPPASQPADPWEDAPAAERESPAGSLLRARMLVGENQLEAASQRLAALVSDPSVGPAAAVARVGVLVQLARFEEADALLDSLTESDDHVRFAKARALSQRGKDDVALSVIEPMLDPAHTLPPGLERAEVLIAGARLCQRVSAFERAADLFEAAIAADPMQDDAYVGLVSLYGPRQPLEDETKLVDAFRRMREANPSSRALRWMRAQESVSRGQLDLAERDLSDLAEESPTQAEFVTALNDLWVRTGSAAQSESWLRGKLERFPDSSVLAVKLADALIAQGKLEDARAFLAARLEQTPGDAAVSRALERLLRTKLSDPAAADDLARRRLANSPATPDTLVEQADLALRDGRLTEAADQFRALLDRFPSIRLGAEQATSVGEFIVKLCTPAADENTITSSMVDLVNRLMNAAPGVGIDAHRLRLIVNARSGLAGIDELKAFLDSAIKKFPQRAEQLVIDTVNEVLRTQVRVEENARPAPAEMGLLLAAQQKGLQMLEAAPQLLGKSTVLMSFNWVRLAIVLRNADSLERAVERARADGVLDDVAGAFGAFGGAGNQRPDNNARADGAHDIASALAAFGREAAAEQMYRLALRFNPNHAPTCNNFGYRLLLEDKNVQEAHDMIARAAKQEPNNSSFTDSLGWARYKLGIIFDDKDPATGEKREGAITLLGRALTLTAAENTWESEISTPVLVDHLGDASWAAGDQETAARHWEHAADSARAVIEKDDKAKTAQDPDEASQRLSDQFRREIEAVSRNAAAKSAAAREGRQPPVSKVHKPINQPEPAAP